MQVRQHTTALFTRMRRQNGASKPNVGDVHAGGVREVPNHRLQDVLRRARLRHTTHNRQVTLTRKCWSHLSSVVLPQTSPLKTEKKGSTCVWYGRPKEERAVSKSGVTWRLFTLEVYRSCTVRL